jgi:hypothetical protein
MTTLIHALTMAVLVTGTAQAQTLHKCTTPSGDTEYRNSPCAAGQRSAGAVNRGTVTTMSPSNPAPAANKDAIKVPTGLDGLFNPIKAMRDDAAPIDKMAFGMCKSEGGHYVEGAGCLSEAPKNRNPLIGEVKMREICQQTGKPYVKALNDCVTLKKP